MYHWPKRAKMMGVSGPVLFDNSTEKVARLVVVHVEDNEQASKSTRTSYGRDTFVSWLHIDHPDDRNNLDYAEVMITVITLMIPTRNISFGRSPRARQTYLLKKSSS